MHAEGRPITLESDERVVVLGDAARLRQIVDNLAAQRCGPHAAGHPGGRVGAHVDGRSPWSGWPTRGRVSTPSRRRVVRPLLSRQRGPHRRRDRSGSVDRGGPGGRPRRQCPGRHGTGRGCGVHRRAPRWPDPRATTSAGNPTGRRDRARRQDAAGGLGWRERAPCAICSSLTAAGATRSSSSMDNRVSAVTGTPWSSVWPITGCSSSTAPDTAAAETRRCSIEGNAELLGRPRGRAGRGPGHRRGPQLRRGSGHRARGAPPRARVGTGPGGVGRPGRQPERARPSAGHARSWARSLSAAGPLHARTGPAAVLRRRGRSSATPPLEWLRATPPRRALRQGLVPGGPPGVAELRGRATHASCARSARWSPRWPRCGPPPSSSPGTWDLVVPPSVSASIAASIPGSELVSVARTGHFVPRDAPDVVASAVRSVESRARDPGHEQSEHDTPT